MEESSANNSNHPAVDTSSKIVNHNSNGEDIDYNAQLSTAWSNLATGAVSIWKKATDVTADIINVINQPEEEEDFRFPRPHEITQESILSSEGSSRKNTSSSTMSSWDSLPDLASSADRNVTKSSIGNATRNSPMQADEHQLRHSGKKIGNAQAKESTGEDFFASFGV